MTASDKPPKKPTKAELEAIRKHHVERAALFAAIMAKHGLTATTTLPEGTKHGR